MSTIYKDTKSDEYFYPENRYILSETDDKGLIVYANTLFCEIANYSIDELIGEPHNIVRHPDMPRIAFKGLWDDVQTKGFWSGYVKNSRRGGGYYWVHATVLRRVVNNKTHYLSIRVMPSRSSIEKYSKLYAELKADE